MEPIRIMHFSDVLCVWAYVGNIRMVELARAFGEQISVDYRFCSVFGDTNGKIERGWTDRGGAAGYSAHVRGVVDKFPHVTVHPEIWTRNVPSSSLAAHVFLCAVKLLQEQGLVSTTDPTEGPFERAAWRLRRAFFTELVDVSDRREQLTLAEDLGLPVDELVQRIDSGEACARLMRDLELARQSGVRMSPTLLFNEGRQLLMGNVGYRVIEANVQELLRRPLGEPSWC